MERSLRLRLIAIGSLSPDSPSIGTTVPTVNTGASALRFFFRGHMQPLLSLARGRAGSSSLRPVNPLVKKMGVRSLALAS